MAVEATQLRKGVLELATLALLEPSRMYGAEIVASLASTKGLAAKPGTVYPLLSRLAQSGLVTTAWEQSPSGPPRKYYTITAKGRTALAIQAAVWRDMAAAPDSILGGRHAGGSRPPPPTPRPDFCLPSRRRWLPDPTIRSCQPLWRSVVFAHASSIISKPFCPASRPTASTRFSVKGDGPMSFMVMGLGIQTALVAPKSLL